MRIGGYFREIRHASVTLTVNISPALTTASRVAVLATTPSSASPPEDYTFSGLTGRAGSRMLALPANATTATFTLSAVADGTTEGAETATWFLQKVTGEPYTVVRASDKATITIADTSTAAPASANALVSNLGQTTFTTTLAIGSNPVAQKFTTGSATAGYTLASLEIDFAAAVGTPANLRAELWSATGAGAPDSKLASLTVPSTVGAGAAAFAAPSNTSLDASTSYFVVVYRSGTTTGSLRTTRTNNEDSGSASGWSIGDTRHGRSGTSWRTNTIELKIRVNGAVKGATQSTDASLSALAAKSATSATGTFSALALSPSTFSASTTAYTASVANSITHVKLTPTKAHTGASIKVGTGTSLSAVTSGTESTAIALGAAGTDTAIKVEVTAQDGTTKRTYTVTVTRALAVPTGAGPFCCWQQQRRPNADRIWPAPHRGEFSARAPVLVVMERSLLGKGVVHLESKRRDRSVCRSSGAMIATQQVTNALVGQIEHLCGQAISAVAHFG